MPFYKKPFIADAEAVVKKALKDSEEDGRFPCMVLQ